MYSVDGTPRGFRGPVLEVKVLYPNPSLHRKVAQLPFFVSAFPGRLRQSLLSPEAAGYKMFPNYGYREVRP